MFTYYGARSTFEKDFYVIWYAENERLAAQANNTEFDEAASKERLRSSIFWRQYFRYGSGPSALLLGLFFLGFAVYILIVSP